MFIYLIRNTVNGKIYVGKYQGNRLNQRFCNHCWHAKAGNGMRLCRAIRKYGRESFTIEAIESDISDPKMLAERESFYIAQLQSCNPAIGYNTAKGGFGGGMIGKHLSEEHKAAISRANRGRIRSEETRRKLSARVIDDQWRERLRLARQRQREAGIKVTGHPHSAETRHKLSIAHLGKQNPAVAEANRKRCGLKRNPFTEEHRRNISLSKQGKTHRPMSEESKAKSRLSNLGQKRSPETCAKIAAKAKKRWENPEARQRLSEQAKRLWADPNYRTHHIAAYRAAKQRKRNAS